MDKISIIVPVYNTEQYLEECIHSLLNQSYKNIEIVIINDNSNEYCSNLIKELEKKDNRIIAYHLTERIGVGAARNLGVKRSSGQYIYFVDSDDYIPEYTLELLIENIKNHNMICGKLYKTHFNSAKAFVSSGLINVKWLSEDNKYYKVGKDCTILNTLFRKDFIIKNNLLCSEEVEAYSDLSLIVPALTYTENIPYIKEAIYFKRLRNDPITNPSILQKDKVQVIKDFLTIYSQLKDKYEKSQEANWLLDKMVLNFYKKEITLFNIEENKIDLIFDKLITAILKIDPRELEKLNFVTKREIKKIKSNNIKSYKSVIRQHQFLRDLKVGLKSKRKFFIFLYQHFFIKLPIKKNVVFFESFLGKSYSDSPKYIYEYMIDNNMDYKFVWSFNDKKNIPGNPIQVKRFSLKYFYYLARAKYWVSNSRLPKYLTKPKGNIYLQTWHGTPLKKLVFDMQDVYSANPDYKEDFYMQSRRWDFLSSANQYSSDIFRRAFKYEKEMLEFGYPRNDILYTKNNINDINKLKKKLKLPQNKKVILYAPTWRDDEYFGPGKYKFTLQLDLEKLRQSLGDEYIVLLRMHYFIASQLDISDYKGFAYDFSSYDDIAELYLVSDILITDYSSVFFDYANLKRPMLFYTYDLEKYRDQLRGFYLDIENDLPGPLVKTTEEIIENIKNLQSLKDAYRDKYDDFYQKFCKWDDGNASEKTVKRVFNV